MQITILAIDDAPEIHALLDGALLGDGLRVLHAVDPHDGLNQCVNEVPDLVLLDLHLPGLDGFRICETLKLSAVTAHIPVIFLSSSHEVDDKVKAFDLGAADYVCKPFHPAELRARMRSALRTKRYQDLLAQRTQIDGLTGLRNRAYFDRRLAEEVAAVRRYGRALSLVMVDIDHFKRLNDTYGHPFGDLVLQQVAEGVTDSLRAADVACRIGGEELALILPETSQHNAMVVAERVRTRIRTLDLRSGEEVVRVTASFGVVGAPELEHATGLLDAARLLKAADEALYHAKHTGRDRVVLAEALAAA